MHVLFVFPSASSKYIFVDYHQGIGILSALLKQNGHSTSLLRISHFDARRLDREVEKQKPDMIAYSFTSDQAPLAIRIMQHLAPRHIFSIAGGVHPTVSPEDIIPYVDAVCRGEGEGVFLDLMHEKPLSTMKNLWLYNYGDYIKNDSRPFWPDLNSLPFPDREIFDYQQSLDQDHRADFMAGRGCPFRCSYCINNRLLDLAPGKPVRLRSVDNVLSEIKEVLEHYSGIESICFQDDTFALRKIWLAEFCQKYKNEIHLPFVCNLRINSTDQDTIDMLAEAGCQEARIGVEQGNENLRTLVLHRKMSNTQIIQTFAAIRKAGIKAFSYNMIGIPGETEQTIAETVELNKQLHPDKLHVSIFHPYPGTELYDLCSAENYFTMAKSESYFQPISSVDLPTISKKKIEYHFRIFRTAVMYPSLLPLIKPLARLRISRNTTLYDALFQTAMTLSIWTRKNLPRWVKDPVFRLLKI